MSYVFKILPNIVIPLIYYELEKANVAEIVFREDNHLGGVCDALKGCEIIGIYKEEKLQCAVWLESIDIHTYIHLGNWGLSFEELVKSSLLAFEWYYDNVYPQASVMIHYPKCYRHVDKYVRAIGCPEPLVDPDAYTINGKQRDAKITIFNLKEKYGIKAEVNNNRSRSRTSTNTS